MSPFICAAIILPWTLQVSAATCCSNRLRSCRWEREREREGERGGEVEKERENERKKEGERDRKTNIRAHTHTAWNSERESERGRETEQVRTETDSKSEWYRDSAGKTAFPLVQDINQTSDWTQLKCRTANTPTNMLCEHEGKNAEPRVSNQSEKGKLIYFCNTATISINMTIPSSRGISPYDYVYDC